MTNAQRLALISAAIKVAGTSRGVSVKMRSHADVGRFIGRLLRAHKATRQSTLRFKEGK